VVGDIRGKTRLPAAFRPLEKAKAPLLEGGIFFIIYTPTQPAQVSTYAPTHASKPRSQPLFSSFRLRLAVCPPVLAWGAPWLAPCGRAAPWLPCVAGLHRGCGRLVATTLP
jgi:hypothetical protein